MPSCECAITPVLATYSLTNYQHIILMAIFFLMTYVTIRNLPRPFLWSMVAVVAMGLLVELEEGATRFHHCRMRDLIPDVAGGLVGMALVVLWRRVRRPAAQT